MAIGRVCSRHTMIHFDEIWNQLTTLDPTPGVLAIVLGGLIGLEREIHGRPAGLRTHILVCLATTLLIYVSRHLPSPAGSAALAERVVFDHTRLAAGIMTGIGFLGAATVIRAGDMVRGITTGACIWAVAALGIAIGYEAYGAAVATTCALLLVLIVLDRIELLISPLQYRRLSVRGSAVDVPALSAAIRISLETSSLRIQEVSGHLEDESGSFELVFHVRGRHVNTPAILALVVKQPGVTDARWK